MKASAFPLKDGFGYYARRFFASKLYIFYVMLAIFVGHVMAWEAPVAILLFATLSFGFFFAEDLRFLLPVLLGGICVVSVKHTPFLPTQSDYFVTDAIPVIIGISLMFAVGLTVFILRRRHAAAPLSSLRLRWGFLGFFAAMLFSGLFQENALKNFAYGAGIGAVFLAVYLLFGLYHPKTKENAQHFLFTLLAIGLLISLELLVLYFRSVEFENGLPVKNSILIGWGSWTTVGVMIGMCLPAPFYFARTAKRGYLLYLLSGAVMTVALLLSASRASWLYGGVILLSALTLLCLGGSHRRAFRIGLFVLMLVGVVGVVLLLPKILAFLSAFVQFGVGDNGRFDIWKTAVRSFLAAPIFGRGFFNTDIVLEGFPQILPYMYHNTPLQMLGSAGAVGFLLYAFHRYETVRLLLQKRRSLLCLSLLLVPVALVLFSITDEHFFHFYPAFFYSIALSLAEGCYEEEPLFEK